MRYTIFTIAVVFTIYQGCSSLSAKKESSVSRQPDPLALVATHDASKTFDHVAPPSEKQLRTWATRVAVTGGAIAFGLVGDPDSTGMFIRERFLQAPAKPESPTYLDESAYNKALDSITQINRQRIQSFVMRCLELIRNTPPQQHTDLNGRLRDAAIFFQEPGMENYLPVFFTTSDGRQDVQLPTQLDTVLNIKLLPSRVRVFHCRWKNPVTLQNAQPLESPDALDETLQSFTFK